jgi:hypothetical protein
MPKPKKINKKKLSPSQKKSRWKSIRKNALSMSISAGLGAAYFFGGQAIKEKIARNQKERAAITHTITQERIVRNPQKWARISQIYGFNPAVRSDVAKIRLIESISVKTKVPVKRVLITLEREGFHGESYKRSMDNLDVGITGAKSQAEKDRYIRMRQILMMANKSPLAEELQTQMRETRGSLRAVEKLK